MVSCVVLQKVILEIRVPRQRNFREDWHEGRTNFGPYDQHAHSIEVYNHRQTNEKNELYLTAVAGDLKLRSQAKSCSFLLCLSYGLADAAEVSSEIECPLVEVARRKSHNRHVLG